MLNNQKLIEIFSNLVHIPSPSLSEDKEIAWIKDFCAKNHIHFELDNYENVYLKVKPTMCSCEKQPILLSAHMDVMGDSSPINVKTEDDFICTDGKRTLGADDKVGVAASLLLAAELSNDKSIEHGGLEVLLTRDEEHGMTGINHVEFEKLNSKYVFALDADKLGQLLVSGASMIKVFLKVTTPYGGHSGIDIHEKHRLNAAKLITEIICNIPQGVYYKDETGTITSINLGTIIAGNIQNSAQKAVDENIKSDKYLDYFIKESITNVINTEAQATFSIRSASNEKEKELKQLINGIINEFNEKYKKYAKAELTYRVHVPAFEKSKDDKIEKIFLQTAQELGIKTIIGSYHAAAETHVYAQKTNINGDKFSPFLIGIADVFNMHSKEEKVDYKTMIKGYELLKQFFINFNK